MQAQPMTREQAEAMMRARRGGPPPQAAAEQPKPEEKKEGEAKPEEKKDEKKEEDSSVKRPKTPPRVPDPRELEVKLDRGRVPPFNFIGQPWPDVLQWLANISNCSLDWQELPDDYLNLTTQRPYPVDEVRDLINRHLTARGYTMLVGGEVLSVFKIDRIDPSLVPRVTEEMLYDMKPYDFVKVSFELPEGLEVDKAKDDVKQILSPTAKVLPLSATRRILVIDAVANLRNVSELLNQERMVEDGRMVPRAFPLQHARAEQVVDVLYVILGLDPKSRPSQMDLALQQKRLEILGQMQQSGKDVSQMLGKEGPPVYLAYNRQTNTVLVNAPPQFMKIIERAIRELDVPPSGSEALAASPTNPAGAGARDFKKYQLVTMDPDKLVVTLEEIGGLSPWTQLRADAKSKTLFVQGSPADHAKIQSMIDQLDGSGRELKVIWLPRRLPADAVAGTIAALMAGQEEEEEEERRPFWYYRFNEDNDDKPKAGFRIEADVENNRLLLWANQAELEQVHKFLEQLSGDGSGTSGAGPIRVIDPRGDEQATRLLERLRRAWPSLGDNELIIDDERKPSPPAAAQPQSEKTEPAEDNSASLNRAATRWQIVPVAAPSQFVELRVAANDGVADRPPPEAADATPSTTNPSATEKSAPVTITIADDGRLIVSSQDQAALDRLETFVEELAPVDQRWKIFRLNYAKAIDVYYNLKEYFEEELAGERGQVVDWWGDIQDTGPKDKGMRLSKRRALRLIWDPPSNSILVANASPSQLAEIEQLIKEYDQPASADSTKTRVTRVIKVRYSRASKIAAAIKDVYRDLLSSKDKEFDSSERKQQGSARESVTVIRYGSGGAGGEEGGKKSAPMKVGFEGALSIGADDVSNVLLVSAQEEIYDGVEEMIRRLDEEARPRTTVQVHRVSGNIDPKHLQRTLNDALGTPWLGGRPEKAEPEKPAAEKPKPEGENRRGEPKDE